MPEIKHNFTTGKMNQDLDERLVQNGEYRDAMNIQVSTSDGSDVGTVQNILGNSLISDISYLTEDAVCIASIPDEKNDSIYWFVYDNNNVVEQSFIFKYNKTNVSLVFADLDNTVLKFSKQYITAINIIDGLMFFTDGVNEPKKINMQDCIDYTTQNGSQNTQILIEKGEGLDPDVTTRMLEKHITVIKKAPLKAPLIDYTYFREPDLLYSGVMTISKNQLYQNSFLNSSNGQIHDFTNISAGDSFITIVENDINGGNDFTLNWSEGTNVIIKEFDFSGNAPSLPLQSYALKGFIEEWEDNVFSNQTLLLPILYTSTQNGWNEVTVRQDYTFNGSQYYKISSRPWHVGTQSGEEIEEDKEYKIKFTLYADGDGDLEGKLTVRLFSKEGGYGNGAGLNNYVVIKQFDSLSVADAGEYEYDFTPQNYPSGWTSSSSWNAYASCLQFEAKTGNGVVFKGGVKDFTITRLDAQIAKVKIKVTSKDSSATFSVKENNTLNYVIDTYENETGIFEDKMARFAFRYKYKDNEYSSFSPFTNVVFAPGNFNYNSVEAYNSGMTNNVKSVILSDFDYRIPEDVKSIDILYKEESSASVYIVDTVKTSSLDTSYSVTSESVRSILAEEQFLRVYDNVPRSAKTQEIIGNRLVYGNYKQNYDLVSIDENNIEKDFEPKLDTKVISNQNPTTLGAPSIKSSRKYQVGIAYQDEYGRQTPVLTSSMATVDLDIDRSTSINKLSVLIKSLGHPVNMKYFKFYVKDNSGEYYNIAMDRWYDAEDGNVWLAFPSSDRNKVEIDDFLILKKGIGTESPAVVKDNKYKVIDIQNEAPENIKREDKFISKKGHKNPTNTSPGNPLFIDIPVINKRSFSVEYNRFSNGTLSNLHENFSVKDISTRYFLKFNNANVVSDNYEITDIVLDSSQSKFTITVDKRFKSDVAQFSDDPKSISDPTLIVDNTNLSIYISNIENSPKFDGRFFVKIFKDANYTKFVESKIIETNLDEYVADPRTTKTLYYCKSNDSPSTQAFNGPMYHGETVHNDGVGDMALGDWWGLGSTADYSDPAHDSTFPLGKSSVSPPLGTPKSGYLPTNACLRGFMEAAKGVIRTVGDYSYAVDAGSNPSYLSQDSVSVNDSNYVHKSWLNYIAWKAWFRGINTEQQPRFANSGRVEKLDLDNNRSDRKYEDVWFINETRNTIDMPYLVGNPAGPGGHVVSSTYPTANSGATGPGNYTQKGGWDSWQNAGVSHLNIAFGAIEVNKNAPWIQTSWSRSNYQSWYHRPNYFDLQSHPVYGETQGEFVQRLSAGSQFRFRQDPARTIYTIEDVHIDYMLMYDNLEESSDHSPKNNSNHFLGQLRVAKGEKFKAGGGAKQYGNEFKSDGVTLATNATESEVVYSPATFLDAANYAINYKLFLDKPISWNPIESHNAPITGGHDITLAAGVNPVGSSSGGLFTIVTNSVKGLDEATEKVISIEVGMVLESYVDATDGSTQALSKKAVVHDISFLNNEYTIKFKAYDGNDDNLDSANAVGNIPNIVAGDSLRFRQYSMNGMCPNSAKNLNYFRDGGVSQTKSGVTPLGYDIEFLEVDFSEDSEYLVPSDPAVWETEHRESTDIDLYYEASNSLPILDANSGSLEELIPIGSTIEHLDSNAVSLETKVLSISGNVLTTDKSVKIIYTPPSHQTSRDFRNTTGS